MGLLNKLFGFRWSLYIVKDGALQYAMHEHSVIRMVGYVMAYFAGGKSPRTPWELYLNFNHKHITIKLIPEHFTKDGKNITPLLIQQIEKIDPGWKVKGGEPVFEEIETRKKLKISNYTSIRSVEDVQARIKNANKPDELTFYSVMDMVFGER